MLVNAIEDLFTETGIITASDAEKHGFEKDAFYQYVKENNLERIGHGIYIREDAWPDDLFVLHKRCPAAVFSHEEALYYHNLTDREPIRHTLTIYTGYNTKRLVDSGCKVYTVKKDLLDVGKVIVKNNYGNDIPVYDVERTVCDIVRSRRNIEIQEFNTALKAYAQRKDKDLNKLMSYAQSFHVDKMIRQYMEVLL